MVDLAEQYAITSNRESGYGRYDVMLKRREDGLPAMILEFKVRNSVDEGNLEETVWSALRQIQEKKYATSLVTEGFPKENIRAYGFAFEGKKVRIDGGNLEKVKMVMGKAGKQPAMPKKVVKKTAKKKEGNLKEMDLF